MSTQQQPQWPQPPQAHQQLISPAPLQQGDKDLALSPECLPSLDKDFLDEPSYSCPAPAIKLQATPAWVNAKPPRLRARCSSLRLLIWGSTVLALVAAAVGLSVTMAIMNSNREDNGSGGSSGGHGGGGSSGGGSGRPARPGELGAPPFAAPEGWTPIWWDEFSGDGVDTSKWNYDLGTGDWGWGNGESQKYTKSEDNVRVANGSLVITALRSPGGAYTSGRINTLGNAAFYPGMPAGGATYSIVHIEARIKVPAPGQGLWPAFWMFPVQLKYGKWAASGEIDVMESVNGMETITQGIHFGGPSDQRQMEMARTQQPGNQHWADAFHTYAIDWAADNIVFYVDGRQVGQEWSRTVDPAGGWWTTGTGTGPNAPFDAPFYLILNLAVGGLFPKAPDSTTPASSMMMVDYVRIWAK